jgi:hypothetical protein
MQQAVGRWDLENLAKVDRESSSILVFDLFSSTRALQGLGIAALTESIWPSSEARMAKSWKSTHLNTHRIPNTHTH